MKYLIPLFVCSFVFVAKPVQAAGPSGGEIVVTSENIEISDKALERKLAKLVKEKGTLTSTRQVNSYMLALLCEYPHEGSKGKPICSFRKVKASH